MPLTVSAIEKKRQADRKKQEEEEKKRKQSTQKASPSKANNETTYTPKMTEAKKAALDIKIGVSGKTNTNKNTKKVTPKNAYTDTGTGGKALPTRYEKKTYTVGGQGAEKGRGLSATERANLNNTVNQFKTNVANKTNQFMRDNGLEVDRVGQYDSSNYKKTRTPSYIPPTQRKKDENRAERGSSNKRKLDATARDIQNRSLSGLSGTGVENTQENVFDKVFNPTGKFISNAMDSLIDNSALGTAYSMASGGKKITDDAYNNPYEEQRKQGASAMLGNMAGVAVNYGIANSAFRSSQIGKEAIDSVLNGTKIGTWLKNSSVTGKIGQLINRTAGEIARDRVGDAISNIAVGLPLNFANNYAQGYRGDDLKKQMALDTAADFGFDFAGNVAGDVLGAIGKNIQIKRLGNVDAKKGLEKAKTKSEYIDNLLDRMESIAKGEKDASANVTQARIQAVEKLAQEVDAVEKMTDAQFNRYKQGLDPSTPFNVTRGQSQPRVKAKTENAAIRPTNDTYGTSTGGEDILSNDPYLNDEALSVFERFGNNDFESELEDAIDTVQRGRIQSGKSIIKDADELTEEVRRVTGKDVSTDEVMQTYQNMTNVPPEVDAQIKTDLEDELKRNQEALQRKPSDVEKEVRDSFPDATAEEREALETAMRNQDADAYRRAEQTYNDRIESERQKRSEEYNKAQNVEEEPLNIPFSELDEGGTRGVSDYEAEAQFAETVRNRELPKQKKAKKALPTAEEPKKVEVRTKPETAFTSTDNKIKVPKRATNKALNSIAKENDIYVPDNVTIKAESGKGGADRARRKPATKAQIQEAIENNYKRAEADLNLMEYQRILNDAESSADDILNKYIAERSNAGSPIGNNELSALKQLDKDELYNAIEARTLKINGVKSFDDLADLLTIEKRGWAGEISADKTIKADGSNKKRGSVTASDVATIKMGDSISVPTGDLVADLGDINNLKVGDYLVHNKHGVAQFEGFVKDKSIADAFGLDKNTNFLKIKLNGDNNSITIRPDQANNLLKRYVGNDTPELGKMFDSSDVAHSMNAGVEDELTKVQHDKYGTETSSNDIHIENEKKLPKKLDKSKARKQWENWKDYQPEYLEQKAKKTAKAEGQPLPKKGEPEATANTGELPKKDSVKGAVKYNNKTNYTIEDIAKLHGKSEVEYGKDVMRGWQTYSNADITPEELRKRMAEEADKHLKKYVSNKKVIQNAEKQATEDFETMATTFFGNAKAGRATTSQDIANGYVLAKSYIEKGDYNNAMKVYTELTAMQSEVGRALQAQRMFSRLTPEGRLRATLSSIEKIKKSKGVENLKIDDNLLEAVYKADTDEALLKANKELATAIWDQIPPTLAEKANALRYLFMLGNPKTHIRNVLGNAFFMPARAISDGIASGLEKGLSKQIKAKGGDAGTHAVVNPFSKQAKEYRTVAKEQFDKIRTSLDAGNSKYFERIRPQESRIFKMTFLDEAEKANSRWLEKEDVKFMKVNFDDAFTQYCTAKKIKLSDLKNNKELLEKVTDYAYEEALKATYRDANALADALNKLRNSVRVNKDVDKGLMKVGKGFVGASMDAVAPFLKTPLNILKRGTIEYSPIGLFRGLDRMRKASDADEFLKGIEYLANGITGSGLLALGYFAGGYDIVNGTLGKWDDKVSYEKMLGKQDYALNVGGRSITIDWVAPMSMPFFVGVEAGSRFMKEGINTKNMAEALNALTNITEPIFELSMLQGVENTFQTAFSEGEGITQIGKNAMFNYASQFVPTALGQFSRTITKNRKIALSTSTDPLTREIEKQLGNMANKVPALSKRVNQDYVDQWGRTDSKLSTGDYVGSAFENFLSPAYISKNKKTPVDEEILRMYDALGEEYKNQVIPKFSPTAYKQTFDDKDYVMTPAEFTQYKKTVGQAKYSGLEELFKTDKYKDASDDEKRKMITQVYEDATAKGKDEYLRKVDKDYASAPEFYNIDKSTRDKYYTDSLGISKKDWGKAWHAKHDLSKAKEEETGKGTNAEEERIILLDNGVKTYEQAQSLLGKDTSKESWEYAVEQHEQGVTYKTLQKEAKTCPNFYSLDVSQKRKWSKDLGVDKEVWGKAYQTYNEENKKKREKTGSGLNSEEAMILLKENGIKTLEQARTINGNIGKTFLIFDNDSESAWDEMVKAAKNGKTFADASKEGYASAIKRNQAKEHVTSLNIPEKHQSSATTIMTKYDGKTVKQDVYDLYVRQVFYNNDNNPNPEKRNNTLDTTEIKSAIEKMDKKYGLTQAQKAYLFANTAPKNYKNPYG